MTRGSKLDDKRRRHDAAYLRAKRENYAARAIYKLEEIDQRFRLVKVGARVLDLGCWPGSWLQYVSGKVGPEGQVVGVDLKQVDLALPSHVTALVGDVDKLRPGAFARRYGAFDLVLSDMAPHTTGDRASDQHGSEELFLRALTIARGTLRVGGHFAAKVFQGPRFRELIRAVEESFGEARAYRPLNTRPGSTEQYLVGRGLRGRARIVDDAPAAGDATPASAPPTQSVDPDHDEPDISS